MYIRAFLAWGVGCADLRGDPPPRRIALVTVHGLPGGDPVAHPDALPALAGLAGEALRYDRATAAAPSALASLGTLLTGVGPARHGLLGPGLMLDPTVPTVAERFVEAGWATRAVAVDLPGDDAFGLDRGFADFRLLDDPDRALDEAAQPIARPTLLWAHVGGDVASDVDQRAARLVSRLRSDRETVVVLVGDRGPVDPDDPFDMGQGSLGVPLVLWWAEASPRVEGLAAGMDVAATLLALGDAADEEEGADLRGAGSAVARSESSAPCAVGAPPRWAVRDADGGLVAAGDHLRATGPDGAERPLEAPDAARAWVTAVRRRPVELAGDIDPRRLLAAFQDGEWPLWPGACDEARGAVPSTASEVAAAAALGLHRRAARLLLAEAPTPAVTALAASAGLGVASDADDALAALARFTVAERAGDGLAAAAAADDLYDATGAARWALEAADARGDRSALARIAGDLSAPAEAEAARALLALADGDPPATVAAEGSDPWWQAWVAGRAAVERGDDRAAIEAFTVAVAHAPWRRTPRQALAEAWTRVGRPAEAARALAPLDD